MGVKNKVDWCLKTQENQRFSGRQKSKGFFSEAEKEMKSGKHRGLIVVKPSKEKAREHIAKAEHYLEASLELKGKFSDVSAGTTFYSIYHSLLAVLAKFGYESGNQECTFAVISDLIENEKIDLDKEIVNKISLLGEKKNQSIVDIREKYQYGTDLSMENKLYEETLDIAKRMLGKAKEIIG